MNKEILIIEDDKITAFIIQRLLEGIVPTPNSTIAINGKEALTLMEQRLKDESQLPDILLLDLNMPVMDGWQMLNVIKEHPKLALIPIFILTSSINKSDKTDSESYTQVKGFITKPLKKEQIQQILEHL